MTTLELQYFEIIDLDYTGVEARIFVDGNCSRVFRNFEEAECELGLFANQPESFDFADEQAAINFVLSSRRYFEMSGERFAPPITVSRKIATA